jgi:3-phosphoshikimate 1-carboxyvinyltransferase
VSHRAAFLAAMAHGRSVIRGFSPAGDCQATLDVLASLGVRVERAGSTVFVSGRGPEAFVQPDEPLDCVRSGSTMRLAAGVLAGPELRTVLTGHPQLLARPMERVAEPLRLMGAHIELSEDGCAPMTIVGGGLHGHDYRLPVPSAQVKSAVLLAGLQANGATTVTEPIPSRDHTERLLSLLGAAVFAVTRDGVRRVMVRRMELPAFDVRVAGDLSSAAALVAAATVVPNSELVVDDVGLNPTRTGFLRVLRRMGADLVEEPSELGPEPAGRLVVRPAPLVGTSVDAVEVPMLIDELPLLGVIATQADGVTRVTGAAELRVKESDRIEGLVTGLRTLGANAEETEDGFVVEGPTELAGGLVDSRSDHRLAMAFSVAGLVAKDRVRVDGMDMVGDSFPGFAELLGSLR